MNNDSDITLMTHSGVFIYSQGYVDIYGWEDKNWN